MNLKTELLAVLDALDAANIDYALCGGLALAIHGHPRFTNDIDILLLENDLARFEKAVKPLGFDLVSGWITFDRGTPKELKIYRIIKAQGNQHLTLDALMVTPIQQPNWDSRQRIDMGDRYITVVSREALIRMKRATGRTQDLADIEKLGDVNDFGEEEGSTGNS